MKYYYANSANQPVGPLEFEEISRLAQTGVVNDQTHVIPEGSQTWTTYGQLRASLGAPAGMPMVPPPPPAPRGGMSRGAKISLIAAAAVVVAAIGGAALWALVLNRPSGKLVSNYVAAQMSHHDLQLKSLESHTQAIGSGQVRVTYTGEFVTTAPLYAPIDTPQYLQDQFGFNPTKFDDAQSQARNVDPADLATIGAAPADPLSAIVIKPTTPSGTKVAYTGSLLATRANGAWSFADEQGGQYAPREPEGALRSDIEGETYVAGDPTDTASLKALVDKANDYADKIAQAMPAGLPPGVKTVVKLAKAGVGEDALLVQVHADGTAYKLNSDQILYLSRAGVSQNVIKALLEGNPPPASPSGGEAGGSEQASTLQLPAATPWFDTGIAASAGQPLTIAASGSVYVGALNGLAPDYQTPAGAPGLMLHVNGSFLAANLPVWSLIGKIGQDGDPFEVGTESTVTPSASGELYLSVNDSNFSDNRGSWTVSVTAGSQPAAGADAAQPTEEVAPALPPVPPPPTVVAIGVPGNVRWFDTGIDLAPGEPVSVIANGLVSVHAQIPLPLNLNLFGRRVTSTVGNETPDGNPSASTQDPFHPYVAPGLPAWSLVATVGGSIPFEVGSDSTFNSPAGGRLLLSVNANSFEQNEGIWNVTVTLPPAAAPEPPAQVTFDYVHDQLAPYGNWVQVDGYGWCWNPAVAAGDPNWRPYFDQGHWIYTNDGWFWQSAYPWGDIAFHYGRWYQDPSYGWLWVPGYDWAPAWVCWRNAEDLGFLGWAPLPPGAQFVAGVGLMWNGRFAADVDFGLPEGAFVFIGFDHFWEHNYRFFLADRARLDFFYHRSFMLNGYRFAGGRFIMDGLGRNRIGRLTHRKVRVMAVRDVRAREEKVHFDARREEVNRSGARGPERGGEYRGPGGRPAAGADNRRQAAPQAKKAPAKPQPANEKKKPNQ